VGGPKIETFLGPEMAMSVASAIGISISIEISEFVSHNSKLLYSLFKGFENHQRYTKSTDIILYSLKKYPSRATKVVKKIVVARAR
jgi:hypothetical protein